MHPHISSLFFVKPYQISRGSGLIERFIDSALNLKEVDAEDKRGLQAM